MAVRVRAFNLLRPGLRCLSRNACSFSSNMVVRVTTRNSFSLVHTSAPSASDMAVQVTPRDSFSLGHTSALLPLTWRFKLRRATHFPLGIPVPLLPLTWRFKLRRATHFPLGIPVPLPPLTWRFKLRRAIMRPIMRAIMRPNYFFVQDCFSVGTACVFIAFIAAPYASGRRSLQTVGIFWTKYQAIRCLQYGVGKKELAQRGGRQSPAALRAKITPFCR